MFIEQKTNIDFKASNKEMKIFVGKTNLPVFHYMYRTELNMTVFCDVWSKDRKIIEIQKKCILIEISILIFDYCHLFFSVSENR